MTFPTRNPNIRFNGTPGWIVDTGEENGRTVMDLLLVNGRQHWCFSGSPLIETIAEPKPYIVLCSTTDYEATIAVNGVRYNYRFLTKQEVDTVQYLFKHSGLKALNYAKSHSEEERKL